MILKMIFKNKYYMKPKLLTFFIMLAPALAPRWRRSVTCAF